MPCPTTNMHLRIVFLVLSMTSIFIQINGQTESGNIKFNNISIKNGLSQSSANCIFQDSQGIMWIGTEDGLNKYDGYSFKVYKPLQEDPFSISSSRITAISEDKNGNLWIGTNGGGLNLYDKKSDRFYHVKYRNNYTETVVNCIGNYRDQVWVGTNHGLFLADATAKNYSDIGDEYAELKAIPAISVKSMLPQDNNLWIGTTAGLFRYDYTLKSLIRYSDYDDEKGSLCVTALLVDRYHNLVLGTESKLFKMNPETGDIGAVTLPGLSSTIKALIEDNAGNIWIATFGNGIYIGSLQSGIFSNYQYDHLYPYSIHNNEVLSLFMDYSGMVWAGTNGIDIYNPLKEKFILYDYVPYSRERLVFRNIHPIYQDATDVLWIGSKTDGVHILDRSNQKYSRLVQNAGLSSNRIRSILEYPEGVMWIGTEDAGIDKVYLNSERKPVKFKNFASDPGNSNSVNSNTIYTLYPDRKGNMWIGTDNGLAIMDIETETITQYLPDSTIKNSISNSIVYSIFGDSKGNIWLATDLGVNKYDPSSNGFIHFKHNENDENSIIHNEILCFHEDIKGNLWIGTYGKGFDKLDTETNRFTHFNDIKANATAVIYGILEDHQGNLWMSSNNGLLKFNEQSRELKQFNIEDGLQSNEFNGSSYFINNTGEMFFGGQFGFNSFIPEQVKVDTSIPGIILADLVVHNISVLPGEDSPIEQHINVENEINLNYRQNNFTLYFSALHFGNSQRNQYKYKLEGFDKDWIDAGTKRFVSYTNLPYKSYTFRVKASNSDGVWNDKGISIKVRVHPPIWATTVFRIVAVLVILGGIGFIINRRITYDERQKKVIEEKLYAASKELEKARQQMEEQRSEIVIQKRELAVRQKDQENLLWFNQGLGVFSELISKNRENLPLLCKEFIEKLTEYIEAQQGGVFLFNDDVDSDAYLELIASYAYASSRHNQKFASGEGYVGVCFKDKKFVEIDNLTENYSEFGSGLGRMHIKHLVLAPLVVVNECVGVIELGSFKKIKGYRITFIEKLAENFASTVLTEKANARLRKLIEQSNLQAEELSQNEESIRMNLEELMAAQEESARREDELIRQAEEAANHEEMLNNEIELLKLQIKEIQNQSSTT
jgi:ligand-binding sensor domain-containing protein